MGVSVACSSHEVEIGPVVVVNGLVLGFEYNPVGVVWSVDQEVAAGKQTAVAAQLIQVASHKRLQCGQ
jgi:hypothetical protein